MRKIPAWWVQGLVLASVLMTLFSIVVGQWVLAVVGVVATVAVVLIVKDIGHGPDG